MGTQKSPHSVKGWQMNCANYEPCPLCYGCRRFDSKFVKCVNQCGQNERYDTCNGQRHRPALLSRMVLRERIELS